jgi:hypothetical protein
MNTTTGPAGELDLPPAVCIPESVMDRADDARPLRLDDINTDWHRLDDREQLVLRYAAPARAYLFALLRDPDAADEVAQQVLLRIIRRGFGSVDRSDGRFRDYLKAVLRNAARTHQRRNAARPSVAGTDPDQLPAPADADGAWLDEWRRCVLDRVWDALADHERRSPGNLARTVLRAYLDHPDAKSTELARTVAAQTRRRLRADAFRKQLSRARRLFAELLVREVGATLEPGTREQIEEELATLGFLQSVRDYLPPRE